MPEIVKFKSDGKLYQYNGTGDRGDRNSYTPYTGTPFPAGSVEGMPESTAQEMHPEITAGTRLLLKNLSTSPEASAAYIRQEYPGMQVRTQNGQLQMKRPEEPVWRVLDPDTGFFSKDILNDAGDIIGDTTTGVLSGLAATAAGGAAAPSGPGAIAAAMGAGGASSAGLEATRQKLGQRLGIPQEMNWGDVGIQGAVGTAAPLLMGAGGAKDVLKQGVKSQALTDILQRGVVPTAVGRAAPVVGEAMSGVPAPVIKTYFNRMPVIDKKIAEGVSQPSEQVQKDIDTAFSQAISKTGGELERMNEASQIPVDITSVKGKIDEVIRELEGKKFKNEDEINALNQLKAERDKAFQMQNPNYEDELRQNAMAKENYNQELKAESARQSLEASRKQAELQKVLKELGIPEAEITRVISDVADPEKAAADLLRNKGVDDGTITEILGPESATKALNLAEPQKFVQVPDQVTAAEAFELQRDRVKNLANYSQRQSLKPRNAAESLFDQRFQNAASAAYQELNQQLEQATQGSSQSLKDKYKELIGLRNSLDRYFSTPDKTYDTLSKIHTGDKKYLLEQLDKVDSLTGGKLGLRQTAEDFAAAKYFENPAWFPLSGNSTTSTSRTAGAGLAGGMLGAGAAKLAGGSPFMGAMIGSTAGATLGGPKMLKQYIKAARAAANASEKIPEKAKRGEAAMILQQYLQNKSEE